MYTYILIDIWRQTETYGIDRVIVNRLNNAHVLVDLLSFGKMKDVVTLSTPVSYSWKFLLFVQRRVV